MGRALIYGSVCSGVEAATVAWHSLGWQPQWFSEIEKFPSAVLKHHYPAVPNHGDMTKFKEWNDGRPIDVLVGGTPCQSFSVAGLRKGLDDPRGNLMLTYLAIAARYRPRWLVWENVPGVLSSNKGRDFGTFLGALGECGYGFAYRVLDAQYFGVAQRRRRVFVVGYLGSWQRAAAVLFERHSLQGNIAPRRQEGEKVAPTVTTGAPFSSAGNESVECEAIVPVGYTSTSFGGYHQGVGTIRAAGGDLGGGSETLCVSQRLTPIECEAIVLMDQGGSVMNVMQDGTVGTLRRETHGHEPVIVHKMAVRRLTPIECERLQGFPDNYTDIRPKGKPTPDGPRYKAMGNSMAVPVMRWIGERIQKVEDITQKGSV
jgi:DNA (cytosine-5)-methyltransferase 1